MKYIDVFNGDADGVCSLQQLRLEHPVEAELVTGVKRDIALLGRVEAAPGDVVTVLDVSLDKNRVPLLRLLERGVSVRYFDHHYSGEIPNHPLLDVYIEATADKGTSLLVDDYLCGTARAWAVVGTFGDNFDEAAYRAVAPLGLDSGAVGLLRELGILLNYNGYGETVEDLHVAPEQLFYRIAPYTDPLAFVSDDSIFSLLRDGFFQDMERARAIAPELKTDSHAVFIMPAESWARRASGVYANELAQSEPSRAHAMFTRLAGGGFVVSVRAPLARADGADQLCRQFATGGGRKAAAGINHLPEAEIDQFVGAFVSTFRA